MSGSRLKLRYTTLVGADGTRLAYGDAILVDSRYGVQCWPVLAEDGRQRCMPLPGQAGIANVNYWSDASCGRPIATIATCAPDPVLAVGSTYGAACGLIYAPYQVGARVTPTVLYTGGGAACRAVTPDEMIYLLAAYRFYSASALAPSGFVEITTATVDR